MAIFDFDELESALEEQESSEGSSQAARAQHRQGMGGQTGQGGRTGSGAGRTGSQTGRTFGQEGKPGGAEEAAGAPIYAAVLPCPRPFRSRAWGGAHRHPTRMAGVGVGIVSQSLGQAVALMLIGSGPFGEG